MFSLTTVNSRFSNKCVQLLCNCVEYNESTNSYKRIRQLYKWTKNGLPNEKATINVRVLGI